MAGKTPAKQTEQEDRILEKLGEAGRSGLSKNGLGAQSQVRQKALTDLVKQRRVTARQVGRYKRYWLPEHAPSLETVEQTLNKACGGKPDTLYRKEELKRLLPQAERSLLEEALPHLIADRTFHELRRGKSRYYLHLPSFTAVPKGASGEVETKSSGGGTVQASTFSAQAVRRAYTELVEETYLPFVMISRLARESGQDLDALHDYLLKEQAQGRAELSEADWSIASEEERAAAISKGARRYLSVRLQ